MATYNDLQTRVYRALIDQPTAITQEVPTLINEALTRLQNKHNFFVMKTSVTFTTASTRVLGAVPSNWKEPRGRPYLTEDLGATRNLRWVTDKRDALLIRNEDTTGYPQLILQADESELGAGNFEVYPTPDGLADYSDGEYRITIPYWRYMTRLSGLSDTNWFLNNDDAVQYLIRDAVAQGFELNEDDIRSDRWIQRQGEALSNLILADKRKWLSYSDTMAVHLGANEPMVEL